MPLSHELPQCLHHHPCRHWLETTHPWQCPVQQPVEVLRQAQMFHHLDAEILLAKGLAEALQGLKGDRMTHLA